MLRKVMPYAPYIVVIISLIVAIVMVVVLNNQNAEKSAKKKTPEGLPKVTQTAGDISKDTKPTYKVRTAPAKAPTVETGTSKPAHKTTPANVSTAVATTSTSTPVKHSAPAKSSDTLVNTGPGETVAMFAGVALVGAAMHSFLLRKKLQS